MRPACYFSHVGWIVLSLTAAIASADEAIKGSGVILEQTRNLPAFDAVEFHHAGELEIVVGRNTPLKIRSDDNVVPLIESEVRDRRLIIRCPKPVRSDTKTTYLLGVEHLTALDIRGAVTKLLIKGINGPQLDARISGVVSEGALSGQLEHFQLAVSGSANLVARELLSQKASVVVSGVGTIDLNCEKSLDVVISGSASVTYAGKPELTKVISGNGSVKAK